MGKHIGGAVNYVAISNALVVSSSVLASTPETSTSPQVTISSNFTLAPKLNPSSSEKKTNNRKKTKASTEKKLKLKKSQSETIIEPAVLDCGGMKISSLKNNVGDGRCTPEIKSPAMICAEEVQSNLEPEFPSFAKSLDALPIDYANKLFSMY
ncbi:hypothetical protein V6N13_064619 [Hibiscus sabdariffa]